MRELKTKQDMFEYFEGIIHTMREPLIMLDQDLRVVTVSNSFYKLFKLNPANTIGHYIYELANKQFNISLLRELLETILPQKPHCDDYLIEHHFDTIGQRIMLLNARQIELAETREHIILLAIEDMTERTNELVIANEEIAFQNKERNKLADELDIANEEKDKRADELDIANQELAFQNQEKDKRADELVFANHELAFQNQEKDKRADELGIANQEKDKRADELNLANKELAFQNQEKDKRANELVIANQEKELLLHKLKRAASVFSHADEGIMITDASATITEVNSTFSSITGYTSEEVLGENPKMLQSGRHSPTFYAEMWDTLLTQDHWRGEIWNRRKNGEIFPVMLTISAVKNSAGFVQHYVSLCTDITAMKEYQGQLEHVAYYDVLTNLPNRVLLADRVNQAMAQCERRNESLAVAFMDLDGFKEINDNHGHNVGDELLVAVSQRMKKAYVKVIL
jgi:PAS domain S-box-containing protein